MEIVRSTTYSPLPDNTLTTSADSKPAAVQVFVDGHAVQFGVPSDGNRQVVQAAFIKQPASDLPDLRQPGFAPASGAQKEAVKMLLPSWFSI